MCLGSKTEQRKWWLYNRFKYIDSKYNAGSAAADSVSMRTWYSPAAGETYGITVTPYADIYATIMYGVSPSVSRAPRNTAVQLACNLDHLEFTDTYIYSASQIKSFGDLSPFKPDAVEFSKATHVQELKFGDASPSYTNPNLKSLTLGNNTLLKKLDCRNCTNLGTGSQKSINIENCSNIEEVYFDGTQIQGLTLPNGGFLKKLHLPNTMTNLTLLNQKNLTEFVCPGYTNVTTCRLENNSSAVDTEAILRALPASARLRLIGFEWETEDIEEVYDILDILDTMRGIDEQGNTIAIPDGGCRASINGTIHTGAVTGDQLAEIKERYPYLNVTYTSITSTLTYKNYDGTVTLHTETISNKGNGTWTPSEAPTKPTDEDYRYIFGGWSKVKGGGLPQPNATVAVEASRTVYAAFNRQPVISIVYMDDTGTTTLHTEDVTDTHEGSWNMQPAKPDSATHRFTFVGWSLTAGGEADADALKNVTEKRVVYAAYTSVEIISLTYMSDDGETVLHVDDCTDLHQGSWTGTPTKEATESIRYDFAGWALTQGGEVDANAQDNVTTSRIVYAVFDEVQRVYLTYMNEAGTGDPLNVEEVTDSHTGSWTPATTPTKVQDAEWTYAFSGWSLTAFGEADNAARSNITSDRTVYTAFAKTKRQYTVTFKDSKNNATLYTVQTDYGATPVYAGVATSTLTDADGNAFEKWEPDLGPITGATTYTTKYVNPIEIVDRTADVDAFFTAIENGTVEQNFKIGNYFTIDMGSTYGTALHPQIVGFGTKNMPDGTPSKVDIIFKDLLLTKHRMNATNTNEGGWAASEMMSWLAETGADSVWSAIPSTWREHIIPVINYSYIDSNNKNAESTDKLSIPSLRELSLSNAKETSGPRFSKLYNTQYSQAKGTDYFSRSASTSDTRAFRCVSSSGGTTDALATDNRKVCLSFSLGTTTDALKIQDSWDQIFQAEIDGTAASKYPVGSTKAVDLGTEGNITFEVAGHGVDELADGSGNYAATTWVAKKCLNTLCAVGGSTTTYAETTIRSHLVNTVLPKFPSTIRDAIVGVKKYSGRFLNNAATKNNITTEQIWTLSARECTGSSTFETLGPVYSDILGTANSRVRALNNSKRPYSLRSCATNGYIQAISDTGSLITQTNSYKNGVVIGFCTNARPSYTVTFTDSKDGSTLYTTTVKEGDTPVYAGATATSELTDADGNAFESWTPALGPVTANTTYTTKYVNPVEIVDRTADVNAFLTALDNGTVKQNFKIGNYFTLNLGSTYGTALNAQIAGFGKKLMPDGTPSQVDIIFKEQLLTTHKMNETDTTEGGWAASGMRSWLAETGSGSVWDAIPSTWRSHIISVVNYSTIYNGSANGESIDKLWIPSQYELNLTGYETTGAKYSALYSDNDSRIKTNNGNTNGYWTRSADSSKYFRYVSTNGGGGSNNAISSSGVVLGFSLGSTTDALTIQDDWATILANEAAGNYSQYEPGMMKAVDLGTEGNILFEIAGHGLDELADGTGMAATTWIAKTNAKTKKAYHSSNTVGIKYSETDLRNYIANTILPMFPDTIKESIVSVKKYSSYVIIHNELTGVEESNEKLWIPSEKEVGLSSIVSKDIHYSNIFTDNNSRRRSQEACWWLRSGGNNYRAIQGNGTETSLTYTAPEDLVLGFCTGVERPSATDRSADVNAFFSAIDNGTVSRNFKVGDYFTINMGDTYGTALNAQIVGFGTKSMSNGIKSSVDIIFKDLLLTKHNMNNTNTAEGGWKTSNMRSWLAETSNGSVWDAIPTIWRNHIISVVNNTSNNNQNIESIDKLFIPSSQDYGYYDTVYSDVSDKIKTLNNTEETYWCRSSSTTTTFHRVNTDGSINSTFPSAELGVCLCFSLGTTTDALTISDSWQDVLTNITNDTYKSKYNIGEYISLDLGTQGSHLAQIVAFDEGNSHMTFITKDLLVGHRMNPAIDGSIGTGALGGWENCEMRTYLGTTIKPLMPEVVRNALVTVSKSQSAYDATKTRFTQTTQDDLWIPSFDEMQTTYNTVFVDDQARKKHLIYGNTFNEYWQRSASESGSSMFKIVSTSGVAQTTGDQSQFKRCIALGFQI